MIAFELNQGLKVVYSSKEENEKRFDTINRPFEQKKYCLTKKKPKPYFQYADTFSSTTKCAYSQPLV